MLWIAKRFYRRNSPNYFIVIQMDIKANLQIDVDFIDEMHSRNITVVPFISNWNMT